MQPILDILPVILFFAVYSYSGSIYLATATLMGAMVIQIAYQWIRHRTVSKMLLISGGIALVAGGATLILQNEMFIKWKPTIANWLFAVVFAASPYFGNKTLIERMMGESLKLPKKVWQQLNWTWVANFTLLGGANLYVVYQYSTETWVTFKLASIIVFTLLSFLITIFWVWRHLPDQPQPEDSQPEEPQEEA